MAKLYRLSKRNKKVRKATGKSRKIHQRGGSPASSLLFRELENNPQTNSYNFIESYKAPANLVQQSGGSLASSLVLEQGQDNPGKSYDFLDCANTPKYAQSGGSLSSEMVMGNLTEVPLNKNMAMGVQLLDSTNKPEYLSSVKLYSPLSGGGIKKKMRVINKANMKKYSNKSQSAGGRRSRRRNNKKQTRKHSKRSSKRSMSRSHRSHRQRGGGSDWITSQYSAGPVNYAPQSAEMTAMFTSSGAPNTVTLDVGKAGSGYPMGPNEGGTTGTVGAPVNF